ncbi:MAG: hypothetical protein EZS28_041114, partial [Streblomastix strix]
ILRVSKGSGSLVDVYFYNIYTSGQSPIQILLGEDDMDWDTSTLKDRINADYDKQQADARNTWQPSLPDISAEIKKSKYSTDDLCFSQVIFEANSFSGNYVRESPQGAEILFDSEDLFKDLIKPSPEISSNLTDKIAGLIMQNNIYGDQIVSTPPPSSRFIVMGYINGTYDQVVSGI